jgi:hypothetical protein
MYLAFKPFLHTAMFAITGYLIGDTVARVQNYLEDKQQEKKHRHYSQKL